MGAASNEIGIATATSNPARMFPSSSNKTTMTSTAPAVLIEPQEFIDQDLNFTGPPLAAVLTGGSAKMEGAIDLAEEFLRDPGVDDAPPVALMTYYNPVMRMGEVAVAEHTDSERGRRRRPLDKGLLLASVAIGSSSHARYMRNMTSSPTVSAPARTCRPPHRPSAWPWPGWAPWARASAAVWIRFVSAITDSRISRNSSYSSATARS